MGRRKIEIQPLADERNRTVTFVKRKAGLFKKAYELSVLCKVDLAVIIIGNNNKVYEFSSVDMKEMVDFYLRLSAQELKLPENYGPYKKKPHLSGDRGDPPGALDLADLPDPKRHKPSIYSQQQSVSSRFLALAQPKDDHLLRPVLRVQIPESKSPSDPEPKKEPPSSPDALQRPPAPTHNPSYAFKFKSPDSKKPLARLPPLTKLQTLSPLLGQAPQLPVQPGFFPLLPQPLPLSQFPPQILPTPVLNQIFNANYAEMAHGDDHGEDLQKSLKPPGQQQLQQLQQNQQAFAGDQTPVLGLPSRYMNDMFPSPLTMYNNTEWPAGITPVSNMAQYFGGATLVPNHHLGGRGLRGNDAQTLNPEFVRQYYRK